MDLIERIRTRRRELKLSQDALARRADVSASLVNQMERRIKTDPHYSTLRRLATALDMSVSELVEEEESSPKVIAPPEPEVPVEERREEEIDEMDFDSLVALYQELTERRDAVARALVRKGPYTETPLSAKQREQRESRAAAGEGATSDTAETA